MGFWGFGVLVFWGEVEVLDKYIKDNSVVFDLGANLGAWSLKVLENKKNVNLHLFEASP